VSTSGSNQANHLKSTAARDPTTAEWNDKSMPNGIPSSGTGWMPSSLLATVLTLAVAACAGGSDPRPTNIGDVSEGAGPPPRSTVEVSLPTPESGVVSLPEETIAVTLSNGSAQAVVAKLAADVQANGVFARVELGDFEMTSGAALEVPVAVRTLGIDLDTLETSAAISFHVLVESPTGEPLDGQALPTWYLHRDGGRVVLYDQNTLIERYRGGDLTGAFLQNGVDPFPNSTKIAAGVGAGEPDPNAPPPVLSSGDQVICIHWKYRSLGHYAGETYYAKAEPMAARGVKVAVQSTAGTSVHLANRTNGCLAVKIPGGVFQIVVHAHAVIGNGHDILVRAFELPNSDLENKKLPDSMARTWVFKAIAGVDPIHIHVPADASSTMMAFGTFSAASLDALVPVDTPSAKLDIRVVGTRVNSDADAGSIRIAPSQQDIKFVYGHEVGHWYAENNDFGAGTAYAWTSKDIDCASNDPDDAARDHLMRSTEYHGAAFKEGLAHALSTFVWNGVAASAPRYRYYKDLDDLAAYDDLQADFYRIDMAARTDDPETLGGQRAWRSRMCSETNDPRDEVSVELDWARFFVSYIDPSTNGSYGPAPTFDQLIALLRAADAYQVSVNDNSIYAYDIYPILIDQITDAGLKQQNFVDRFTTLAEIHDITKP
jgi:hypothetical protein